MSALDLAGYGTHWSLVDKETGALAISSSRYSRGSRSYGRPSPQYGYRLRCLECGWEQRFNGTKVKAVRVGKAHWKHDHEAA